MNKTVSIIITLALVVGIGAVFLGGSKPNTDTGESTQNVKIKDGIQYITVNAKGGYSPKVSTAKAGIPTKLIVKTEDTYDCSAALVIRSIGYQKILPQTGEEVIDLGTPQNGKLRGLCSMGMYSFLIKYE